MMKSNSTWIIYNFLVAFSFYWAANLLLWIPWSIDPKLGMAMMLTIAPFLWGLGVYLCLARFPGEKMLKGAAYNASILVVVAVVMDYIFFGLIRDAMQELYHPTTFYGYGFLVALPFIELLIFTKHFARHEKETQKKDFRVMGLLGLMALLLVILFAVCNFGL